MAHVRPARRRTRRIPRDLVAVPLFVVAAVLGYQSLASSSPPAAAPNDAGESRGLPLLRRLAPPEAPPWSRREALGEADGAVPDGTTAFDDATPGVANLDPALLDVLRRATSDAAGEGVELFVESGWRSAQYQERLLDEAIAKHGSEEEAARWVAPPSASAHVSGDAVDVGPSEAPAWLAEHGAEYGLCQIYGNEPWHYELRPRAVDLGCPSMYADPTQDPRMGR